MVLDLDDQIETLAVRQPALGPGGDVPVAGGVDEGIPQARRDEAFADESDGLRAGRPIDEVGEDLGKKVLDRPPFFAGAVSEQAVQERTQSGALRVGTGARDLQHPAVRTDLGHRFRATSRTEPAAGCARDPEGFRRDRRRGGRRYR
ncbi:hypothetical protein ACFPYM_07575, partial [Methylobacterium hispanicum]